MEAGNRSAVHDACYAASVIVTKVIDSLIEDVSG
jgi:hypothetical protein